MISKLTTYDLIETFGHRGEVPTGNLLDTNETLSTLSDMGYSVTLTNQFEDGMVVGQTLAWVRPSEAPAVFDYQDLLRRYINHVGESEGTDFIGWCKVPKFSQEEINELSRLSAESVNPGAKSGGQHG